MRHPWDQCIGNHPALYAQRVLKECRLNAPPICEKTIADYLELEIKEISQSMIDSYLATIPSQDDKDVFLDSIQIACAWLERKPDGRGRIWVYGDTLPERKRLGVVHECSHDILPWHLGLSYLCRDKDVNPPVRRRVEQQAFGCGAEFLMPRQVFVDDVMSLEAGISAIRRLCYRYKVSMEATAIWYAFTHPGLCALGMVEPAANQRHKTKLEDDGPREQLVLPMELPPRRIIVDDAEQYPLKVKYFVKSYRFPDCILSGTDIDEGNIIYQAWATNAHIRGEIPVSVFGLPGKWAYNAECLPLGGGARIFVLLWLPDHQFKLDFTDGVIL
jgi:IrrE N-terminal-like domain